MKKLITRLLSAAIIIIFLFPVAYTITHSFMDTYQLAEKEISFVPRIFNIQQYYELVTGRNEFFKLYLNSVVITVGIIAGQLVVSAGAAYYFAMNKSSLSQIIFIFYIFIMLLPLQITLIPNVFLYNGIERYMSIRLFDTHFAIILPGIFGTLGVFFLKQFFEAIPENYFEMAKIDGASDFRILTRIVLPYSKNPLIALCLLNFIENWNLIEQALIFINTMSKIPVSIYLNTLYANYKEIFYAGSVLFMFPVIYVFMKLEDNIRHMKLNVEEGESK